MNKKQIKEKEQKKNFERTKKLAKKMGMFDNPKTTKEFKEKEITIIENNDDELNKMFKRNKENYNTLKATWN